MTRPPKGKGPWGFALRTLFAPPPQPVQCLFNPGHVALGRRARSAELFARHGFQVAWQYAHSRGRRQGGMGEGREGVKAGQGRAGRGGVKRAGPAQGRADPKLLHGSSENCPGPYRGARGAHRGPARLPIPRSCGPGTQGLVHL